MLGQHTLDILSEHNLSTFTFGPGRHDRSLTRYPEMLCRLDLSLTGVQEIGINIFDTQTRFRMNVRKEDDQDMQHSSQFPLYTSRSCRSCWRTLFI